MEFAFDPMLEMGCGVGCGMGCGMGRGMGWDVGWDVAYWMIQQLHLRHVHVLGHNLLLQGGDPAELRRDGFNCRRR